MTGSPQRRLIGPGMPGLPILFGRRGQDCTYRRLLATMRKAATITAATHCAATPSPWKTPTIETIEPAPYPGRPAHIHVKVFAPDGRELLTTQLYLPGTEGSADVRAAPDLLIAYTGQDENGRQLAPFDFIVRR